MLYFVKCFPLLFLHLLRWCMVFKCLLRRPIWLTGWQILSHPWIPEETYFTVRLVCYQGNAGLTNLEASFLFFFLLWFENSSSLLKCLVKFVGEAIWS